jgi:hypothetical protein
MAKVVQIVKFTRCLAAQPDLGESKRSARSGGYSQNRVVINAQRMYNQQGSMPLIDIEAYL